MDRYLAVDIGAESGRHIVGYVENGEWITEEIYRFPNGVRKENGHLVWAAEELVENVRIGIDKALEKYEIKSFSVDTWGVDYVLVNGEKEIWPCYAYRDGRTEEAVRKTHEKVPFSTLYRHTGSQFQPFNSLYQFMADKAAGRLDKATDFLMMPEYILWKLTGVKSHEFTDATTTGLINADTLEYDGEIIDALGLPKRLFKKLQRPGEKIGEYKVNINGTEKRMDAVLCASHDTGSAVEGIPMEGNEIYISSGTWSLLGVKTPKPITDENSEKANYSNEGGPEYNRYQKNLSGMWLLQNLRKEFCPGTPYPEIEEAAKKSGCTLTVDVTRQEFLAPESMKEAFDRVIVEETDEKNFEAENHSPGDYFAIAYRSLAKVYRVAIEELERNTGKTYTKLYIVGGGAKNRFYCDLVREEVGKEVIALPIEATALGNLNVQKRAAEKP